MTSRAHAVRFLLLVDVALVAIAFVAAYAVRFGGAPLGTPVDHFAAHLLMALAGVAAWPPALLLFDLYEPWRFGSAARLAGRIAQAALLVALVAAALLYLGQAKLASRLVLGLHLSFSALLLWAARAVVLRSQASVRVVVVGAPPATPLGRAQIVARLPEPDATALRALLDREVVDHVLFCPGPEGLDPAEALADCCREVGIDLSIASPSLARVFARAEPADFFGTPVLRVDSSPQFRAAMLGKRAFDLVVGGALLAAAAPLMLAAALAVALTSRGPVLFVQERLGLNGRRFRLLKFRTMARDAERRREDLAPLNEARGPVFKLRRDPRVTPVGRLLRRLSIDELPQLWNVLRGEMSLVGPRPPLPDEVERYDRWQRRRLSIRPGLTCTWQVSGRSDVDFDEWMRLDLEYIDRWSPWLDLKILLRTVPAVLSGRGAR